MKYPKELLLKLGSFKIFQNKQKTKNTDVFFVLGFMQIAILRNKSLCRTQIHTLTHAPTVTQDTQTHNAETRSSSSIKHKTKTKNVCYLKANDRKKENKNSKFVISNEIFNVWIFCVHNTFNNMLHSCCRYYKNNEY